MPPSPASPTVPDTYQVGPRVGWPQSYLSTCQPPHLGLLPYTCFQGDDADLPDAPLSLRMSQTAVVHLFAPLHPLSEHPGAIKWISLWETSWKLWGNHTILCLHFQAFAIAVPSAENTASPMCTCVPTRPLPHLLRSWVRRAALPWGLP